MEALMGLTGAGRSLRWTLGVLGITLALGTGAAPASTLWLVGTERIELGPGERIVGFELTVSSGRIAALPMVPPGWSVTVENYPTWRTQVAGSALIGAAALDAAGLRDLAVVEAYGPETGPLGLELVLTVTADFHRQRRLHLPRERLGVRPR
jgi:hypothetical protein